MITFVNTRDAARTLDISTDRVLQLVRSNRLAARKLGGSHGDYLFHPIDIQRLLVVRGLAEAKQDPLRPDIVWVERACRSLAERIALSEFDPQWIIGIAFGGIVPASLISVFLQKPLCVFRIVHYDDRVRLSSPTIVEELSHFPRTAVVVDDIVDSGLTMFLAQEYLSSHGVVQTKFAALHKKPSASFTPNWYADVVNGWVCYPWEES